MIVLEMETNAKIVEIFAELQCIFTFFEAIGFANLQVFIESDVITRISFKCSANFDPCFWEGRAYVR